MGNIGDFLSTDPDPSPDDEGKAELKFACASPLLGFGFALVLLLGVPLATPPQWSDFPNGCLKKDDNDSIALLVAAFLLLLLFLLLPAGFFSIVISIPLALLLDLALSLSLYSDGSSGGNNIDDSTRSSCTTPRACFPSKGCK